MNGQGAVKIGRQVTEQAGVGGLPPEHLAHLAQHHRFAVQLLTFTDPDGDVGLAMRRVMKRHQAHIVAGLDYDLELLREACGRAVVAS